MYCRKQVCPWKRDEWLDLDEIYVPMTMMTIEIYVSDDFFIKERLGSYHDILKEDYQSTRFLLIGNPGQGKSVLCAKIASDWCEGVESLRHIKLLFILQLGQIDHTTDVEDAICSQLLSVDINKSDLTKIINKAGHSCLILLDSFDEAEESLLYHKQDIGNIVKTIQYKRFRDTRVLVTTRPWREKEIPKSSYTKLELKPMGKDEILKLIDNFFSRKVMTRRLAKPLKDLIISNAVVVDLSNPLITLLVCWYWSVTEGKKGIPTRLGDLYWEAISIMYDSAEYPSVTKVNERL